MIVKILMTVASILAFTLFFLIFFALPSRPAETKNCIPIIEGEARITSVTAYYQSGDIYQLGLYLKVGGVPHEMAALHVLLDIPPNHLNPRALQEALSKNRTLFIRYLEKTCAGEKYDRILNISVQTLKGMRDLTASFLIDKRTGFK